MRQARRAVVVGSGPNGLSAAITLARGGLAVTVLEAADTPGGSMRSGTLTLPGYTHDLGAAVPALASGTAFFRTLDLPAAGVTLVRPPAAFAHPLDDGSAAVLTGDVDATADALGGADGEAYRRRIAPLVRAWEHARDDLLGPPRFPRHPLYAARIARDALRSAAGFAGLFPAGGRAAALLTGAAAHGGVRLTGAASAGLGLVLTLAGHAGGWPIVRGGTGRLADGLCRILLGLGGQIETGVHVRSLDDLPQDGPILLDVTPRQLLGLGRNLPHHYARRLRRWRYGPGAFKVDWALADPIPWRNPAVASAGTVHLGGDAAAIVRSEAQVAAGRVPDRPYVLLVQPTLFDPSRAPPGRHTAWAYCHVPQGCDVDMTPAIEAEIERHAPGFRDVVLAKAVTGPARLEAWNPNLVGGSVDGGAADLAQLVARPVPGFDPYRTPLPGVWICSSSTPPGGGVHGLCGLHAARSVLRRLRRG